MRHPLLTIAVLCGLLAPLGLKAPTALAADGTASTGNGNGAAQNARVIVKFKADSTVMRKQALSTAGSVTAAQAAALGTARASALGSRVGWALSAGASIAERTQVVFAQGISSQDLVDRLAQNSDVEYAVIDQRRHAYAAPNDSYYLNGPATRSSSGGPAVGQWYLRAPDATVKSSIDAESAWAETTGSASIVVAVLDTGLRFDHADLQGGNVLPGYDMIHDAFTANDGGGRDADASDPGDAVTAADISSSSNTGGCTTSDITNTSSWHGTQTLGLIGATTNNGMGIAGVGRNVRVMPVRVLGKCGGYDSDIIAGMRWAAGLSVGDSFGSVPTNSTPARVINLSLGGSGTCSAAYTQAIAAVNAVGAVVVASAGNSEGHAVSTPANCTGVIAVAGLRHVGTKVGFSDLGPEITLSAPGGNCVNTTTGSACLYPIMTLDNSGAVAPVSNAAGGSIYTDSFNVSLGTSFSAPLVSGTVALMLSAQPGLTPAQIKSTLQSTARAFPTSGGDNGDGTVVATCTAPQYTATGTAINQDQCYCTTSTCGAGMLDAGAALRALVVPGVARITQSPAAPIAGQVLTLSGSTSTARSGRSVAGYQWRLIDGGGIVNGFTSATTTSTATLQPAAAGTVSVGLTVTDSGGATVDATSSITVAPPVPGATVITQSPASAVAGQVLTLDGSGSAAATGRSVASYQWRLVDGGGVVSGFASSTSASSITLMPSAAGTVTVGLTVTDSAGTSVDASRVIAVSAVAVAPASGSGATGSSGGGGGGALGLQWLALLALACVAARRTRSPR